MMLAVISDGQVEFGGVEYDWKWRLIMNPDDVDIDPLDLALDYIDHMGWDYEQVDDTQFSVTLKGHWGTYAATVAWVAQTETLCVVCSPVSEDGSAGKFTPKPELFTLLNLINDTMFTSHFSFRLAEQKVVFKTGLLLSGGQVPNNDQLENLIEAAMMMYDQYLPAFNLVELGTHSPERALKQALGRTHGRA